MNKGAISLSNHLNNAKFIDLWNSNISGDRNMSTDNLILAFSLFLIISIFYSSVGHAGASGYLAIMALLSFAPDAIKPTSLILNIIVASIASVKFLKAGYFDRKIFLTLIIASVPAAFFGGYLSISPWFFKLISGLFLIIASVSMLAKEFLLKNEISYSQMPVVSGIIVGLVIGLISGLIGVGGGVFLSPILILFRWTSIKNVSGIAALFILVNSIAGLAGHITAINQIDFNIIFWVIAVIIGAMIGTWFGAMKFNNRIILVCLSIVMLSAGLKFILSDLL